MSASPKNPWRIAAVLACYNRKAETVRCLEHLKRQEQPASAAMFAIEVFLLDDASSDGTSTAVREVWPGARILGGSGSMFWCGGMRAAWTEARETDPDYYLLLNDDTILSPGAVAHLLELAPTPQASVIAVASIADPDSGEAVFGGRCGRDTALLHPAGVPMECDTMNANCVLVPRSVVQQIGMFHHRYTHAMGDFDYGFTARWRETLTASLHNLLGAFSGHFVHR